VIYKERDISVIIPTYNRAKIIGKTVRSILSVSEKIKEIIIVDQSKDRETEKVIKQFANKKIKYVFSKPPSITIARNLGVKKAKGRIICFLDDDIILGKGYFENILHIFNKYEHAKAVGGFIAEESGTREDKRIELLAKKIFFLSRKTKDKSKIVSAYGNLYPKKLDKIINGEWIPGSNMVYKKDVFKEQKFDENLLGYTVAEDIDFNYRLNKRYPDSIFITPFAKIEHKDVGREEDRKRSYINQVDHFYFNFKNLNNNLKEKVIFVWSLFGIMILRILKFVSSLNKKDRDKLKFFFESLVYCLKNVEKIKQGKVREFKIGCQK